MQIKHSGGSVLVGAVLQFKTEKDWLSWATGKIFDHLPKDEEIAALKEIYAKAEQHRPKPEEKKNNKGDE